MIEVKTAHPQTKEMFQDYGELFDHIVEVENLKMLERRPDFRTMQWSFTAYAPRHVEALYTHLKDQDPAVKEAFENQLPLIEVCTGNFANPEYIVGTANLNISYLKKKWSLAYCTAHGMTVSGSELTLDL